ncbi:hypothetical protein CCM_08477 [Cordyceps militaris CM01]|uniref:C2H2-type domain-containing protein n=1 Tax=Cordyceps militaris (strain CM01) TaxID=983644 RepID=G3JRP3_CORMM|nr:uncharacterized protein CCM_08477 [Cordyceps militaris CM01]EGX88433.1 hypothetical protein CCM_08477 [Cordyceps militaris CM01]
MDQDQLNDMALRCPQSSRYRVPDEHKFSCPECSGEFENIIKLFNHIQRGVACKQALGREDPRGKVLLFLESSIVRHK